MAAIADIVIGVIRACFARSHYKAVKALLFLCALGIINTWSTSQNKIEHSALPCALFAAIWTYAFLVFYLVLKAVL